MVDERLLQRMQRAVRRQALDGGDLGAVLHDRERQAGIDPPPVDQHRAGAALAVIAALLGAGQVEMVAQRVEQRRPRRDLSCVSTPLTISDSGILSGAGMTFVIGRAARICAICTSGWLTHHVL